MLSFIMSGIRVQNWPHLVYTLSKTYSGQWELIIVGPYAPDGLPKENIIWIQDWGSSVRCQQRALCEARGEWICWVCDDNTFLPHMIDYAMNYRTSFNNGVSLRYIEGDGDCTYMTTDDYYLLGSHEDTRLMYVPQHFRLLSFGILSRKLLWEVGGWDAINFEGKAGAELDLAIRLQHYGCIITLPSGIILKCDHMPGESGDHAPLHFAHLQHDLPKLKEIYSKPEYKKRIVIDKDNWQKSPSRWIRRFGKEDEETPTTTPN